MEIERTCLDIWNFDLWVSAVDDATKDVDDGTTPPKSPSKQKNEKLLWWNFYVPIEIILIKKLGNKIWNIMQYCIQDFVSHICHQCFLQHLN